ncbi:type ISP restriction/modification enzyme [Chamaesiphon sp. VAR_48_metabat_135_sub]|uniref:type ISP restriction/modification enzyme n=1 Tax=Chamaesiphon sp. VAR_48_metabat_135_sub TaxID=2964699 RepID=UPI00286A9B51|nr:type ISP restriction/modification enzyme [Chamaesiphon sp. VAR_48_metabat_135_sub]
MSKIFHASLQGLASLKNQELLVSDISKTEWSDIDIEASKFYLLIPQDSIFRQEYERWWKITDVLPVNSMAITTARDKLTIHLSKNDIFETVKDFVALPVEVARAKYELGDDTRDWKIHLAQKDIKESKVSYGNISQITYRPFDIRYTYYTGKWKGFHCTPRTEIMAHIIASDNLGLCSVRGSRENSISNFFVSENLTDKTILSSADNANIAPLYLYPTTPGEIDMGITRKPNIAPEFLAKLEQNFSYIPTPEAIFYYIYAIFYSPTYRSRYAEFLKADFPRVPMTRNVNLFQQLGKLGEQLVNLHLMKSPILNQISSPFIEHGGGCIVDAGHPKYENGKVVINKQKDGFVDVPEAVWNFHVGGYQVCHKWLKDRKGRTLSQADIEHYQKIVVALEQSIDLMAKIDAAIPNWPIDSEYN